MRSERLILPIRDWPELDRARWQVAIKPTEFLRCNGPASRWRSATIGKIAKSYGRWLAFLCSQGWLRDSSTSEVCVNETCLTKYLEDLRSKGNNALTVAMRIDELGRACAVISPMMDRSLLNLLSRNLFQDWNASEEVDFRMEILQESAVLAAIGLKLMATSDVDQRPKFLQARQYRDGLQISLLALRPLRLSNFGSVQIGRHLLRSGAGWMLKFKAHETKQKKPIEVPFPVALVDHLERYLRDHRHDVSLGRYAGEGLWPSFLARPQDLSTIRENIIRHTRNSLGFAHTPHMFRHAAATSLAVHSPDEVQIAHIILGNHFLTMERSYNLARFVDAATHYHVSVARRLAIDI
jgi:integrase/recombinase XerD